MAKESQGMQEGNRQFVERDQSSVTAQSNIAVISEKIILTNSNEHVRAFDRTYNQIFHEF